MIFSRLFGSSDGEEEEENIDEMEDELFGGSREQTDVDDLETIHGEEYFHTAVDKTRAGEEFVTETTAAGETVAGPKPRHMFERASEKPTRPLWVGYDDSARRGFREAPLQFDALKRHLWVSGTTGAGKTTFLMNKAVQHAYAGFGFCNIDPKADGDTLKLLQMLPKHRLDDVILLEPGSQEFSRSVGINMLDMPAVKNDAQREKEIESRLENLIAIFDNDEYWGPKMGSITESIGRAMLRYNAQVSLDPDRDGSEKYTVIDLYFVLLNQERRVQFAESVDDPYLREGLIEIAKMDNDEIRPLTRRIKSWVENALIRKIISKRESTINWDQIVDENKILLVRIPVDSADVHQMVSLTVIRNLWSAKKRQTRNPDRETQPYFLQLDEFERVANDNLAVEDMLVRARSMWLSVCLGTQYPFQIEKDHSGVMRAMTNNANTLVAMRTPGEKDAGLLMSRFEGYTKEDLMNTDFYRCWTKLPMEGGEESPPVNLQMFAPYPPLRSEEGAKEVILKSLEKHGEEPLTDAEIQRELKYGNFTEIVDPENAAGAEINPDAGAGPSFNTTGTMDIDDLPAEHVLEGVYAAQVQHADEETGVSSDIIEEVIKTRYGAESFDSVFSNVLERHDEISRERVDGEARFKLTESGKTTVFSADTGSSASGGGDDHRYILQQSYRAFTQLGAITYLPTQEGDSLPDGVAELPIKPLEEADSPAEFHDLEAELAETYPRLYELSGGRDIAIEAETSTIKKPMQTLTNLRKALEDEDLCVFTCKDASSQDKRKAEFTYWPDRGEKIIYDATSGTIDYDTILCAAEQDAQGHRKFYNKNAKYDIAEDTYAVRPTVDSSNEISWHETTIDDETTIVVESDDGEVFARFSSPEDVADPSEINVKMYREKNEDNQWVVRVGNETGSRWKDHSDERNAVGVYDTVADLNEEYQDLYTPFIPENEFPRMPTDDDFMFVVFPDDDNEEYDEPMIYEQGTLEPLFGEGDDDAAGRDWGIDTTGNDHPDSKGATEEGNEAGEETAESSGQSVPTKNDHTAESPRENEGDVTGTKESPSSTEGSENKSGAEVTLDEQADNSGETPSGTNSKQRKI